MPSILITGTSSGLGKGQPLGTGRFDANKQTVETNVIGALAQTEAAAAIFRRQDAGQLVMAWPWAPLGFVVRHVPVGVLRRMS